ncbi:Nif3-like dinuclear metal center hexameric protein [Collimonas sp.]|jgi:dinuclear metal center YbgI/SA1388 family protein|uniref:Nif3-like dinuclear metal center hexameric protein n=1 Tax=Collimonas sp. TaxID=1963772 RepID=UPI0037BE6721
MSQKSVSRTEMATYLAGALNITQFRDYCPNGLQVEGRHEISRLVTGVTASQALLEAALESGADAILVHHGYFWRGEDARVIGTKHKRLKLLLAHDINLFAYHLPLDSHPLYGNNAQLAQQLGLTPNGRFGDDNLGWLGNVSDAAIRTVGDLAKVIEHQLKRVPVLIGDPDQALARVAWCTGAAQNLLSDAIAAAGVYISDEISEPTVHLARESGVAYLAAGHHATERYGVQALGKHLAEHFGLAYQFIDIDNPV